MASKRRDTPRARRGAKTRPAEGNGPLADSSRRWPRAKTFRSLHLESLEERLACSASPTGEVVSPGWFEDYSSQYGAKHAGAAAWGATSGNATPDPRSPTSSSSKLASDWIVRFHAADLGGITSAAGTSALFASSGIHFDVLCGLGLTGQVLVRSSGASPDAVRAWLSMDRQIAGFEADSVQQFAMVPNDPRESALWGLGDASHAGINAQAAWNITTGSQNVVVAVVDTGVDYTHPDLAANIWTNPRETAGNGVDDDHDGFVDDVHGYNFVDDNSNPMDDEGHGTHVAGIIGAAGNNGVGVTGVNWSVSIMPLKFLDASGTGFTSDAVRAINYATMMRTTYGVNVRVLNMSWGGSLYSASLHDAISAAGNAGILVVAAAGNDASDNDAKPSYPASYDCSNLLTVAATNTQDQLAYFSNWGATSVDLAAPGYQILSTVPGATYASYSGTSMATPYVSGVAALGWALKPDATLADVRNAILQGVDHLPSLSGRVASGGRLDAYNTLQLLRSSGPLPPSIASLAVAPGTVTAGAHPTLTAGGVADPDGSVASVAFYQDTNGNHQWDAGDRLLGTATSVNDGSASLTIDTAGFAPGAYTVFARARDNQSLWSPAVSASLTVVAPDDHGNDPTTATLVSVPSTASGVLETGGDQDWFAFQATAGCNYVFDTTLKTLSDTVLSLYDRNGATRLTSNDDWGSSYASHIAWKAPASGTYYLVVSAYSKSMTGSYGLRLTSDRPAQNAAPILASISDQTIPAGRGAVSVNLSASDSDGDRLTYTATLIAGDPLAQRAYDLDQQLGLSYAGSYYRNLRGYHEEWIRGSGGSWYCLMPSGELRHWSGAMSQSPVIATLSPAYYADPTMLLNARPIGTNDVTLAVSGSTLTITPRNGLTGDFSVQVTVSDGQLTASRTFKVSIASSTATSSASGVVLTVPVAPSAGPAATASLPGMSSSGVTPGPTPGQVVDQAIQDDFLLEAAAAWRSIARDIARTTATPSHLHTFSPSDPDIHTPSRANLVAPLSLVAAVSEVAEDSRGRSCTTVPDAGLYGPDQDLNDLLGLVDDLLAAVGSFRALD